MTPLYYQLIITALVIICVALDRQRRQARHSEKLWYKLWRENIDELDRAMSMTARSVLNCDKLIAYAQHVKDKYETGSKSDQLPPTNSPP